MTTRAEGAEDAAEMTDELRARLRALVTTCKPALEKARIGGSLFATLTLDADALYELVLTAEALLE